MPHDRGYGGRGSGRSQVEFEHKITPDIHVKLDVTLEDVFFGRTVSFKYQRRKTCRGPLGCSGTGAIARAPLQPCDQCRGQGIRREIIGSDPLGIMVQSCTSICSGCSGSGRRPKYPMDLCVRCKGRCALYEEEALPVHVPCGASNGQRIVLREKADESPGWHSGDLVLVLRVVDHPRFIRLRDDLMVTEEVPLREAFGWGGVLKNIDGRMLRIRQPPGFVIRPNTGIAIKGQGMPRAGIGGRARGTLFVRFNVVLPDSLDPRAQEALAKVLMPRRDPAMLPSSPSKLEGAEPSAGGATSAPAPASGPGSAPGSAYPPVASRRGKGKKGKGGGPGSWGARSQAAAQAAAGRGAQPPYGAAAGAAPSSSSPHFWSPPLGTATHSGPGPSAPSEPPHVSQARHEERIEEVDFRAVPDIKEAMRLSKEAAAEAESDDSSDDEGRFGFDPRACPMM